MPGLDGYTALSKLRKQGYSWPIIALTANALREERERCLEAGFDHYLSKPIESKILVNVISQHTQKSYRNIAHH